MGPLLVAVRILPKTSSAKVWILLFGIRRLSHGCGMSHKSFDRNLISDTCTLSKKSMYATSDMNSVERI